MNYNYYHILGVSATATAREIKLAYKALAIQYHPDKHQGNTYFEEKFKIVNEAYQILSNPQRRATYDLKLQYLLQQKLRQQAAHHHYRQYQRPVRRPASVTERHYHSIPKAQFVKKDWYVVAIIFACIIIFSIILKLVMDNVAAKDRYESAIIHFNQKKWTVAHSFLSEAIYFNPDFAEAYMKRAYIEMEVYQDYPAALSDLNSAIASADNITPKMYYLRGKCNEQLHNNQAAETNLSQAIRADENFTLAYYDRGILRAGSLNKYPEAIKDLSLYLKADSLDKTMQNRALLYRGLCYYLTQQNNAALQDYRHALRHDSNNARVYFLMGKALSEIDSTDAACKNFQQAFKLGYDVALNDIQQYCFKQK